MRVDYLIVGQGLAGSALALALRGRGATVFVVDREDSWSASRVAAGLVTTLAGRSMNPGMVQKEALSCAYGWYQALEKRWGEKILHQLPILRLYENSTQREKLAKKQGRVAEWLADLNASLDPVMWHAEHGGFMMRQTGRLDTPLYLELVREELEKEQAYRVAEFREDELVVVETHCQWRDVEARSVILCQGAFGLGRGLGRCLEVSSGQKKGQGEVHSSVPSLFADIPHRSAKGDILTIHAPSLDESQILNRNGWMIPLGEGLWRCGATYLWDNLDEKLRDSGRRAVEEKIQALTSADYTIVDHQVGVRPIIRQSQPVIATHQQHHRVHFFNGLGSKGVMYAPLVAQHFAEVLEKGEPIDSLWRLAQAGGAN